MVRRRAPDRVIDMTANVLEAVVETKKLHSAKAEIVKSVCMALERLAAEPEGGSLNGYRRTP